MRRILFVDDEPRILDGLQRMLRPRRAEWEMQFAAGPAAALAAFSTARFDVVVTDMRMPEMDGAELLEQIIDRWPSTVRLVLSGQTDVHAATRAARVAHQFLSKPCDPVELYTVIERVCSLQVLLGDDSLRIAAGSVESLPSVPAVYASLERALASPGVMVPALASIVEGDSAISAKLLQLVNSSFFGRARCVSRVEQAVAFLGVNVLRSVVLAHETVKSFGARQAGDAISLLAHQRHSLVTAGIARTLVASGAEADSAFTAGMLHDVGKLLLASQAPEYWSEIEREAAALGSPVHERELDRRGGSHAELGAYLLGLWGLPIDIVGAVAFHHRPAHCPADTIRLATAVHVADVLAHEVAGESHGPLVLPPPAELAPAQLRGTPDDWRRTAAEIALAA